MASVESDGDPERGFSGADGERIHRWSEAEAYLFIAGGALRMADGAWPQHLGARLWRLPPYSANTLHKHIRQEEFYFVLEGGSPVHQPPLVPSASSVGRMRIGDETVTVPKHGGVLVGTEQLRQVFNDTDAETLWLIVGAPEELEFLPGSKRQMDLSRIYPQDPTQLPPELAGKQWPPSETR